MITKITMIDGEEHTIIQPIISKIAIDLNNKIFKDDTIYNYYKTMYEKEDVDFPDNISDNTLGGSTLDIDYDIVQNEELTLTTSVYKPINKILWLDRELGYSIRPMYVSTDINLTFTYRCISKTKLIETKNKLQTYFMTSNYTITHELPYSFLIPKPIMDLTKDIVKLKDNELNIYDYINNIATVRMDYAIKRGSSYKVPAFRGKQVNVIGSIMTEPKEIEIEKQSQPEYGLNFTYAITIQQPIAIAVKYPLVINNQKLDDKWIPKQSLVKLTTTPHGTLDITKIIRLNNTIRYRHQQIFARIPDFDNFYPNNYMQNYGGIKRFASILLQIDPDNPNLIFNLDNLKVIGIPKTLIDYFKNTNTTDLFTLGGCLFYMELFEYNNIRDKGLYKDADNNILTTEPCDIKKTYHMLLSINTDLTTINYFRGSEKDIDKMKRDIELCELLDLPYTYNKKEIVIKT